MRIVVTELIQGLESMLTHFERTQTELERAKTGIKAFVTNSQAIFKGQTADNARNYLMEVIQPIYWKKQQWVIQAKSLLVEMKAEAIHIFGENGIVDTQYLLNEYQRNIDQYYDQLIDVAEEYNKDIQTIADIIDLPRLTPSETHQQKIEHQQYISRVVERVHAFDQKYNKRLTTLMEDLSTIEQMLTQVQTYTGTASTYQSGSIVFLSTKTKGDDLDLKIQEYLKLSSIDLSKLSEAQRQDFLADARFVYTQLGYRTPTFDLKNAQRIIKGMYYARIGEIDKAFDLMFNDVDQYGVNQADFKTLKKWPWVDAQTEGCGYAAMTDLLCFYALKDPQIAMKVFGKVNFNYEDATKLMKDIYQEVDGPGIGVFNAVNYQDKLNKYLKDKGITFESDILQAGADSKILGHQNDFASTVTFIEKELAKGQPVAFLNTTIAGEGANTTIGTNHWVTITDIYKDNSGEYYIKCATWGRFENIKLSDVWSDSAFRIRWMDTALVSEEIKIKE